MAGRVETLAGRPGGLALLALAPLALLGLLLLLFTAWDPLAALRAGFPPVEELTIERVELRQPHKMTIRVTNGGPEPVTVAQVLVDEAYWAYEIEPANEIPRLGSATITVPYPWVEGETHEVMLITSTGLTFTHEVAVAVETPRVTARTLAAFTLLGTYVGVIPVLLGLLWYPFLRQLRTRWVHFFLALTAGMLLFLGFDAVHEALETAALVPGAYQGVGLVGLGIVLALAALFGLDGWLRSRRREVSPFYLAALIAIGIGLHNLGEGLAIGAAYALGELALTSLLILGFTLHNTTEGLGIVAPLARARPSLGSLALLGAVAGLPTIAGTWLGGLGYNPTLAVLFLALGAGAIFQVVWQIGGLITREDELVGPLNAAGFVAGMLVMYATGLLVAA